MPPTFDEIADLLEFQNANPFRVRAYRNAARRINDLPSRSPTIAADPNRELTDIEGIGKDLAQKIGELLDTGSIAMLEELRAAIPGGVLAMVRIPGMGPKKAAALHKELGITSLDVLRAACEADQVQALKGFGKKTQDKILAGIDLAAQAHERMYWAHADEIVQELLAHMRQLKGIRQMEVAGSYRRGRETIGDLDLLVDADDADAVMDQLGRFEELATVHRPRRHEDVDPPRPRAADRSARRAGQVVRRRAAILHRLEGPQRRPPRHGQGPRPADQRIRRVPSASKAAKRTKSAPSLPRVDDDDGRARLQGSPTRPTTSPAAPKKKSTRRSTCPGSRPRSAKRARSSPGPPPASCRS